jgi:hypothetical protein
MPFLSYARIGAARPRLSVRSGTLLWAFIGGCISLIAFAIRFRSISSAAWWGDNLIYFTLIKNAVLQNQPLSGQTLLPAPYFIEMAMQFPLAIWINDYGYFVYLLALIFAIILYLAVFLLCDIISVSPSFAGLYAGAALVIFYSCTPTAIVLHAFMQNHVIASIATIFGLFLLLKFLLSESERPCSANAKDGSLCSRRWITLLTICNIVNIVSDPYYLVTFALPALTVCLVLLSSYLFSVRSILMLIAVLLASSLLSLWLLEFINSNIWPHRIDLYHAPISFIGHQVVSVARIHGLFQLFTNPEYAFFRRALLVLFVTCCLAVIALWRHIHVQRPTSDVMSLSGARALSFSFLVMFIFFISATAFCFIAPLTRGAFATPYAYRYILVLAMFLPVISVAILGTLIHVFIKQLMILSSTKVTPPGSTNLVFVALLSIMSAIEVARTPRSIDDPRFFLSKTLKCIHQIEAMNDLHFGLGDGWAGKVINAARYIYHDRQPYFMFQYEFSDLQSYRAAPYSNIYWFDGYRIGPSAVFDYIMTISNTSGSRMKELFDIVGAPDLYRTCQTPDRRLFNVFIYKNTDKQRRLRSFVLEDNTRETFFPFSRENSLEISVPVGMISVQGEGQREDAVRVWERAVNRPYGRFATTKPIFLPPGDYEVTASIEGRGTPSTPSVLMEVSIAGEVKKQVNVYPENVVTTVKFTVDKKAGPTSGAATNIAFFALDAKRVELRQLKIIRLRNHSSSPFWMFQ